MQLKYGAKLFLLLVVFSLLVSTGFCASSYDRELIVQDKTRAMQVESVFKQMMAAYEDEDARGFLDHVSDERFRQDYITFTDALYSDFRNYEIHQVDYWIDKVVPDNVKQFLFVHWEKRYENLDDGRQLTQKGVSRFLFDEVEGDYLLVELAGNHLFGGSLLEWTQEVPQISGQEVTAQVADIPTAVVTPPVPGAVCDSQNLNLCDASNCAFNGGYWYDNTCNTTPQGQPDLTVEVYDFFYNYSTNLGTIYYRVINSGPVESGSCQLRWDDTGSISMPAPPITESVGSVPAESSVTGTIVGALVVSGQLTIDSNNEVSESNESNNVTIY